MSNANSSVYHSNILYHIFLLISIKTLLYNENFTISVNFYQFVFGEKKKPFSLEKSRENGFLLCKINPFLSVYTDRGEFFHLASSPLRWRRGILSLYRNRRKSRSFRKYPCRSACCRSIFRYQILLVSTVDSCRPPFFYFMRRFFYYKRFYHFFQVFSLRRKKIPQRLFAVFVFFLKKSYVSRLCNAELQSATSPLLCGSKFAFSDKNASQAEEVFPSFRALWKFFTTIVYVAKKYFCAFFRNFPPSKFDRFPRTSP